MKQIVLASRNAKKAAELTQLLAPLGFTVLPVTAFSDVEPEETAPTFIENALIKARHAVLASGLPAIADDSGLEVTALDGAPGVLSARYAGEPSDDEANNLKLLEALDGLDEVQRGARFVCALVFLRHADDPVPRLAVASWRGRILHAPQGDNGFGYDPLFWVPSHHCSAAQLPAEVKNSISHRAQALQDLVRQLHGPISC